MSGPKFKLATEGQQQVAKYALVGAAMGPWVVLMAVHLAAVLIAAAVTVAACLAGSVLLPLFFGDVVRSAGAGCSAAYKAFVSANTPAVAEPEPLVKEFV